LALTPVTTKFDRHRLVGTDAVLGHGPTHRRRPEDDVMSVVEAARELVERSTAAQHLPVRVDDPAVLGVVAVLLGSVTAAQSTPTERRHELVEPTTSAA